MLLTALQTYALAIAVSLGVADRDRQARTELGNGDYCSALQRGDLTPSCIPAQGRLAPAFEEQLLAPVEGRVRRVLKRPGDPIHRDEERRVLTAADEQIVEDATATAVTA